MKRLAPYVAAAVFLVIAAVSYHSVEEIHYLKSFFPRSFTVEEAFFASLVEVVKVGLIAFPLLLAWKLWRDIMHDR